MKLIEAFNQMFGKRNTASNTSIWDLLKNDPKMVGFHVFRSRHYVDHGYGRYPIENLACLEYIGSTSDKEAVEKVAMAEPQFAESHLVVMVGKFMDLRAVRETYSETITKEKVVGFKLED